MSDFYYQFKIIYLTKKKMDKFNSFGTIKVNKYVVLLLFLLHLTFSVDSSDFPFQKKIWTYWHEDDLSSAPMLVRQCSEHIRKTAQSAGFQFYRLSRTTVQKYISNFDQKITKVRQKSKQGGLAHEADLIRVNLLAENGGIWMDITAYLYEGLDWLLNIKSEKYRNIITNRFSESPDIMLFYFNGFQNTEQYRIQDPKDKNKLILYNQMPGYEIWFIATKKNHQLIEEIRQTYTRFTQLQFKEIVQIFHNEDIYMNTVDFGTYLTLNMAACYVIQKRQSQLDQQNGLFSTRKTASEYYNLWTLSGLLGPLFWTKNQDWAVNHMIELNRQEYEKNGYMMNLFLKNLGWFSSRLEQRMHRSQELFYDQKLTFQQFLQSKPNQHQCRQTTFLAEDSLLYPVIQNSNQLKAGKIKTITKQEKQKWNQHCKQYLNKINWNELVGEIFFAHIKSIDGAAYRAHEVVDFDRRKNQTLRQELRDFLFQRKANIEYFCKFLAHFSVTNIVEIAFLVVLQIIWKKIRKNQNSGKQEGQNLGERFLWFGDFAAVIFIGTLSFYKYFMIDFFGFRDDPLTTALILFAVYYLQNKIEKSQKTNPTLKTLYDLSYLYISYCTTYMTFCLTRRYKVVLFQCVFVIGLLGPCLMRLYERMMVYKQVNNPILRLVKSLSQLNVYRIGSVSLVFLLYLFPTLRYYVISGHYAISFIPIILSSVVSLCYIILLYECIKTRIKTQILNLLILGTLSWQLYDLFLERNTSVDQNQRRIGWNLIVVALFSIIYLQIGSSYPILARKLTSGEKDQQKWPKSILKSIGQIFLFFGGFFLQIYKGYFSHMTWIPYNLKQWFIQMLYVIIYTFFIAVYIHFRDQDIESQNENKAQPINEMEDFTLIGSEIGSK